MGDNNQLEGQSVLLATALATTKSAGAELEHALSPRTNNTNDTTKIAK